MDGVLLAEGAVLVQLKLVRGVLLVLHRVVVSLLDENTGFVTGEFSLIVSLVLYRPTSVYEL